MKDEILQPLNVERDPDLDPEDQQELPEGMTREDVWYDKYKACRTRILPPAWSN